MVYKAEYFEWQKAIGEISGVVDLFKFTRFVTESDRVLDFGCGGGFMLKNLNCAEKMGIDVNPAARNYARELGIRVHASIEDVPDEFATVVISHHCLEHVERPLDALRAVRSKMRVGAKAVFVVPYQKANEPYDENDINQHLYCWNPLTLGNLFKAAGYCDIRVDLVRHLWPPRYERVYALLGPGAFDLFARIWARWKRSCEVRAVAHR